LQEQELQTLENRRAPKYYKNTGKEAATITTAGAGKQECLQN